MERREKREMGAQRLTVKNISNEDICGIYPLCRAYICGERWEALVEACAGASRSESFADLCLSRMETLLLPPFLPELARLEWMRYDVERSKVEIPAEVERYELNPTLEILELSWKLSPFFENAEDAPRDLPISGKEWAMIWRNAEDGAIRVEAASDDALLALKILAEDMTPEDAAHAGDIPVGTIDRAISTAVEKGVVLAPRSRIRRDSSLLPAGTPERFIVAKVFTLQWHITNACDLSCKHCYDRSDRSPLTLKQGRRILSDFRAFCRERFVRGHVCFTGGNPFLHPEFFELYESAATMGFSTSILGNPVSREKVERMLAIQRPGYFQVSLEGLPEHNDHIRGQGFYLRVIEFLGVLRDLEIPSAVMLTLTKENIDQVLPLAGRLRGHTEHFTFNRLSCVGAGTNLGLPARGPFIEFLSAYVDAAKENPIIGFKDNLINIVLHRRGNEPFDGCTGFGCGAAFNFLAVLPDGETHACRKFSSSLGNVLHETIAQIYDSEAAGRYRSGSRSCEGCALRAVCGGCLSIASSHGLDIFEQRDPYCFMEAIGDE